MNLKQTNILIFLILLVSSCSLTELTVNKRLYNKGFYVNFNKKYTKEIDQDTLKNIDKVEKNTRVNAFEKPLLLSASTVKEVKPILLENNVFKRNILELNKTKTEVTEQDTIKSISVKKRRTLSLISLGGSILGNFLFWGNAFELILISNYSLLLMFLFGVFLILSTIFAIIIVKQFKKSGQKRHNGFVQVAKFLGLAGSISWFIYFLFLMLAILFF
jgi:hypothetical protein